MIHHEERELKTDRSWEFGSWEALADALAEFEVPRFGFEWCGQGREFSSDPVWAFRGQAQRRWPLQPTIERFDMEWRILEGIAHCEFRSQARGHFDPTSLPAVDSYLTWLSLMRHYSVPTRLLDLTFSPWIALFHALRGSDRDPDPFCRIWALNVSEISKRFTDSRDKAPTQRADSKASGEGPGAYRALPLDPRRFADFAIKEAQAHLLWDVKHLTDRLLTLPESCDIDDGLVGVARSSESNPRLAAQQGLFLVNCDTRVLTESIVAMMGEGPQRDWCRVFDVKVKDAAQDIERRLFQMNIHALSLFPDRSGLAQFIEQRLRLQV